MFFHRFYLYLRLFIVMGVTWVMESISFVFKGLLIFYLTDILNCLQGLIIFFLFLWKPKVKALIIKRFVIKNTFDWIIKHSYYAIAILILDTESPENFHQECLWWARLELTPHEYRPCKLQKLSCWEKLVQ